MNIMLPCRNSNMWSPPNCVLSDVQKGDLSQLLGKNKDDQNEEEEPNDASILQYIPRLVSFWLYVVQTNDQQIKEKHNHSLHSCYESIESILSQLKSQRRRSSNKKEIIWLDQAIVTHELDTYETQQILRKNKNLTQDVEFYKAQYVKLHSYGSFLYHRSASAIRAMELALQLVYMTYDRRLTHPQQQQQVNTITNSSTATGIVIRWYHVYPTISMMDIKTSIAYKFVSIVGHVIKARPKRLRIVSAEINCLKCGTILRLKNFQHKCINCRNQSAFQIVKSSAVYIDIQDLQIQESFSHQQSSNTDENSAGRTPRQIQVEVTQDLVDVCQAGDLVHIAGTIQANKSNTENGGHNSNRRFYNTSSKESTSTYKFYMVANSIVVNSSSTQDNNNQKKKKRRSNNDADKHSNIVSFDVNQLKTINEIAHADHMIGPMKSVRMAFPFDLLVRSLCPSIIGHDLVKAGIVLSLLGGTPPDASLATASVNTIRSNCHILIVGDPGMGKSQMLLAANQIASRSVFVGGNTSSTTGLTVGVSSNKNSEDAGIEAGALVLADHGICCIDEFDKMTKANRDGLLEAMEQQQISIAKAGVVATLPARCSVVAAANPREGNYNLGKSVAQNLGMEGPILSRFDLLFILRDEANEDIDRMVSTNIMNSYRYGQANNNNNNNHHHQMNDMDEYNMETFQSRHEAKFYRAMQKSEQDQEKRISLKDRLPWITDTQEPLPANVLRDYIAYAREYCKPKMTQEAAAVLKHYFLGLRYANDLLLLCKLSITIFFTK